MPRKSFLDCEHRNVQDYTEICLDCGYSIWTTKKEYLKDLQTKLAEKGLDNETKKIREAEKALGIFGN